MHQAVRGDHGPWFRADAAPASPPECSGTRRGGGRYGQGAEKTPDPSGCGVEVRRLMKDAAKGLEALCPFCCHYPCHDQRVQRWRATPSFVSTATSAEIRFAWFPAAAFRS